MQQKKDGGCICVVSVRACCFGALISLLSLSIYIIKERQTNRTNWYVWAI